MNSTTWALSILAHRLSSFIVFSLVTATLLQIYPISLDGARDFFLDSSVQFSLTLLLAGFSLGVAIMSFLRPQQPQKESVFSEAKSRKHLAFRQQTFPPAFPNGWYKLCNSDEVPRGKVVYIQTCGQHLAVFRGKDSGKIGILDAFCPHLGANMAIESKVNGDCLQCPFHEWEFDIQGNVAKIPYYDGEPPSNGKARSYECEERFGFILFWFDAENRAPTWRLSRLPAIESDQTMTFRGRLPAHMVSMHIQDFEENGVDFAHFPVLHSRMRWPWTQFNLPFLRVEHVASFELCEKNPHIAYFKNLAHVTIFGKKIPRTDATATAHFNGSGGVIYFIFDIPDVGQIILFETHTPMEPMKLKIDFSWWADRPIPNLLVSYVIGQWYSQWKNDISVWENKIYRRPPIVLKTDGPVAKFRRWYSQFYSESSEKISAAASATNACSW